MLLKKFAMMSVLLATVSACETQRLDLPEVASASSQTSLCLTMRKLPLRPAPSAASPDPQNLFDTNETYDWGLEHNAKLDAACPDEGDK